MTAQSVAHRRSSAPAAAVAKVGSSMVVSRDLRPCHYWGWDSGVLRAADEADAAAAGERRRRFGVQGVG